MVDEEIHVRTIVLYVPGEDSRFGGLEHDSLGTEFRYDARDGLSVPFRHTFGDTLGLNHHQVCPRVEVTLGLRDGQAGVAPPLAFEFGSGTRAARAELNANFRFGFESHL